MEPIDTTTMKDWLIVGLISLTFGILGHCLARSKGRHVWVWSVVCLIPWIGYISVVFLAGSGNLRIERKLDALLARQAGDQTSDAS